MIRLTKSAAPEILRNNAVDWTREYLDATSSGLPIPENIRNRYRHPEVKDAVKNETHNKCIYCESKVSHVYPGDIEHIRPKSQFPALVFEWTNLSYSCSCCNNAKRDYFSESAPLLNPYHDDIPTHLVALGCCLFNSPGSVSGEVTIRLMKLNRADLMERRMEKLNSIQNLINRFATLTSADLKQVLKEELLSQASEDKEYSYVVKSFLQQQGIS